MDYEEFLEAYGKLSFQKHYQQVIVRTLLLSDDFTTDLDDIEKKLKEKLNDTEELGTWWRENVPRMLVNKKIITKNGNNIKLNLEEKDPKIIEKLVHYCDRTITDYRWKPNPSIDCPSDEYHPLEELIKIFDENKNCFGKQIVNQTKFDDGVRKFKKDYIDNDKYKKLTKAEYTSTDGEHNDVFCDKVKDLLIDTKSTVQLNSFGIYYKNNEIKCTTAEFANDPMKQIIVDLEVLYRNSTKDLADVGTDLQAHKLLIASSAQKLILFLMNPNNFLAIENKSTLENSIQRFGKAAAGDSLNLQDTLIEIRDTHKTMGNWTNYEYSYFLHSVEKHFSDMPRFVLCRFEKDVDGKLGQSYTFSDSDNDYVEIQENTNVIFFDLDDKKNMIFWGSGKVSNVEFNQNTGSHLAGISNPSGYGITEASGISTLTEPRGMITDTDLQTKLNKFPSHKIIPVCKEMYDKIKNNLEADKKLTDEPLPLPNEGAINDAIKEINQVLLIEPSVIKRIIAALYSGKSALLTGPIGCGKTELAQMIPSKAWKDFNGYYGEVVTATEDWGTQDVIGGIIPKLVKKSGSEDKVVQFRVQKGAASKTVSENWDQENDQFGHAGKRVEIEKENRKYRGVWLIIDEFNRADIDKAFGGLFTALEYRKDVGIKIPTDDPEEIYEKIVVPKDYRIIGTLNTKDKNYLHRLSDALNRRFETIEIPIPGFDKAEKEMKIVAKKVFNDLGKEIREQLNIHDYNELIEPNSEYWEYLVAAYEILAYIRRSNELGTALLISVYKFILVFHAMKDEQGQQHKLDYCLDLALCNSIIPQISKLSPVTLRSIHNFICWNTTAKIFSKDYMDDAESQKELNEVKELVSFLNDHKEKDKLVWDGVWKEFLNNTQEARKSKLAEIDDAYKKEQAKAKGKNSFSELSDQEQKTLEASVPGKTYLHQQKLDPWTAIKTYQKLTIKPPTLEEFGKALVKIIKERSFEDVEDGFDAVTGWTFEDG
jgi:MoxR-like ATPase